MMGVCLNVGERFRPMNRVLPWVIAILALMPGAFAQRDYLDAELRAKVEQLKKDARAQITNQETMRGRAEVLWPWMNALAWSSPFWVGGEPRR